jgi:hypothetical protein
LWEIKNSEFGICMCFCVVRLNKKVY